MSLLARFCQRLGKAVVNAGLHEDAVGAYARLPGVAIFGGHGAGDGLIEIGIVEYDQRRVAAELERELLHRVGALAIEQLADLRRAGERQLAHAAVFAKHFADSRGIERRSRR